ncbi:MAG: MATE family efflux transporter [Gammaproteobacteria bacterium]|nr:MATE family efflux transporter [Gammaproteobacteria bacterium]
MMWRSSNWRDETRALLRLAGPIIVNNLSIAGMQFADAVMAGRLGAESLAAVAVGGSVWFIGFTVALGTLMAIAPIAARHFGAGNPQLIGRYTRQGLYLGLGYGVLLIVLAYQFVGPLLLAIGIDPDFRELASGYVLAIVPGAPAIFMFLALRFTTEGIGAMRPIMYASIFSLVCNVFLNYVFMFGHFGAPALGAIGCGLASAITMWLIMIALVVYMATNGRYRPLQIFARVAPLRPEVLREIVVLGVPIAIMITAEAGLFNAVSILMGTRGAAIAAAHQIAINFASTMFMVPLALSSAITVRVGHALGSGDAHAARYSGALGIIICALFMCFSAAVLLVFRDAVVGLYTNDPSVTSIAISLLLMAAIFQVADGMQIGAAGALRGYKDTRVPMVINTFAYWVLAFPLAYMAAVTFKSPPSYVWGGFVLGLTVAAVLLTWRYRGVSRVNLATA